MKFIFATLLVASLSSVAVAAPAQNLKAAPAQNISVEVVDSGFKPDTIHVKPGSHVVLKVTRKTDTTCATEINFADKKIKKTLPLNKEVSIDLGTVAKGDVRFACGMNMVTGHIIAE